MKCLHPSLPPAPLLLSQHQCATTPLLPISFQLWQTGQNSEGCTLCWGCAEGDLLLVAAGSSEEQLPVPPTWGQSMPRGEVLLLLILLAPWGGAALGALSWDMNHLEDLIPIFLRKFLPPMLFVSSYPPFLYSCSSGEENELLALLKTRSVLGSVHLATTFSYCPSVERREKDLYLTGIDPSLALLTSTPRVACTRAVWHIALPNTSQGKDSSCHLQLERVNALRPTKMWMGVVWISRAN